MSYPDELPFPEPFGPDYERPPGADCPDCPCCTLRLCEQASAAGLPCSAQSGDPDTVRGCPCTVVQRPDPFDVPAERGDGNNAL